MSVCARAVLPLFLVSGVLSGCATTSDGTAPLNQKNWPICSVIGGLVGGGLGAIESGAWAGGGAALGVIAGGLICFAQDGDEDGDGVFDRRDTCPNTPPNTPVDNNGCPLPQYPASVKPAEPAPPTEQIITLSDEGAVLFAYNKADLTSEARDKLIAIMDSLKSADVVSIKVIGHTDSRGSGPYNQKLSERRAASVATFLISQGFAPAKLSTQGMGKSQPVADNATDEGRAKNRRVEIHLNR
ncbi:MULTISPECIES: OmpA family protein [unclassified Pseudomonas]|uniref:OmpA family protein n=2 Tax=Pseudomonas TaxID=286 RepID=UPI002B227231|nr:MULTISPECIES: OmpA family protein [unclassified Pseudomonas]MEA9978399.1 OmpA family protein [Pseudomonas sp. RTS4]MEB0246354.1 OmpA family protein [Pseudomonas sp. 10S5]